jgi:hypothetical protein
MLNAPPRFLVISISSHLIILSFVIAFIGFDHTRCSTLQLGLWFVSVIIWSQITGDRSKKFCLILWFDRARWRDRAGWWRRNQQREKEWPALLFKQLSAVSYGAIPLPFTHWLKFGSSLQRYWNFPLQSSKPSFFNVFSWLYLDRCLGDVIGGSSPRIWFWFRNFSSRLFLCRTFDISAAVPVFW